MIDEKYMEISNRHKPIENKFLYCVRAFLIGGLVGSFGEALVELYCILLHVSRNQSCAMMIVTLIFFSALLTALGVFDSFVNFARCGLLIPITGFAHSMQSASLEYKNEGFIYGIGSNTFKLAGSVIVYGVVSAWTVSLVRLVVGLI